MIITDFNLKIPFISIPCMKWTYVVIIGNYKRVWYYHMEITN